ncbi:high mobility group protein B3-like [Erinaceus europaeus]|uniref:High mobility group protein B3-like n=1 Tax=Erinaceus europaeus TaxID=9365 RepID=A0ABM3WSL1_ERIEU|nr:high mobility group protein B3-like [Erinaceus europaeus]
MCKAEHQEKKPGARMNLVEFSRKCFRRWRMLSEEEKNAFRDLARAECERNDPQTRGHGPAGRRERDANAPKRRLSASFLFSSDFRPKVKADYPDITSGNMSKKLGEMWSNLSNMEKRLYEDKAAQLRMQYNMADAECKAMDLDGW